MSEEKKKLIDMRKNQLKSLKGMIADLRNEGEKLKIDN
jgi:hypothetical protein